MIVKKMPIEQKIKNMLMELEQFHSTQLYKRRAVTNAMNYARKALICEADKEVAFNDLIKQLRIVRKIF